MKKIFIKGLEESFIMNKQIEILNIENPIVFREFSFEINNNIEIFNEGNSVNLEKEVLYIYNPYQISLNDKKVVTALYKKLISYIDDSTRDDICEIERRLFNLIDKLSSSLDLTIDYEENIDVSKLFNSIGLSIKTPDSNNYFEVLLSFFRLNIEIFNIKYIISFGLTNILTNEEINKLEYELSVLDISLIDFVFSNKNIKSSLNIDGDYCIF